MIDRILDTSLKNRGVILILVLALCGYGIYQYRHMPVDAFPDISPIMVPIFAEAHGMAPEEVERLITYPIESAMNGLPEVTQIKSTSAFGMAVIYVYFADDVDIYFARQLVAERLNAATAELPELHEKPALGPISTGLGQIFIYYLTMAEGVDTGGKDAGAYLREVNDWLVKFQLRTVPGVTEILSIGGHVLQYQIRVDPVAMLQHKLTLADIVTAVNDNNKNAGGQFLVLGSEETLVRGVGLLESLDDLRAVPVKVENGVAVRLGDVAEIEYGKEIRRGVVTRNGQEEVVSGMVLKLFGANTSEVIERLYQKVRDVQAALPAGIKLVPYYEQAELVTKATGTVKFALLQGAVLVLITVVVFLGNLRAALIVIFAMPFCALAAVIAMGWSGLSANLMSLGGVAIAIGMLGDGAIVVVENIYRRLNDPERTGTPRATLVLEAAREVGRPVVYSIGIIIVVFLPIFTLEGVEGKMFKPLALTVAFALGGSMLAALVVAPVLASLLLRPGGARDIALIAGLKRLYRPLLERAVRYKGRVLVAAGAAFLGSLALLPYLGTEFIPTLEEGSILITVTLAPSISLEKATDTIMKMEQRIVQYPEVRQTVSRVGRPEAGSHPHPVNYAEVHIDLEPMNEWTRFGDKQELVAALRKEFAGWPGVIVNFTQPIQNAFDELLSGIRAQLAIKLFGEDLEVLQKKAGEIRAAVESVPGLVDLSIEQSFGQPQVQIVADRAACARYGVSVAQILELVELAIGGEVVDTMYQQTRRFGIQVRLREDRRADVETIRNLLVPVEDGTLIPLAQVARIEQVVGPVQIQREKNQRRWIVQGNIRGRDMGGVIADIQDRIRERVTLPPGYTVEYGGQFENQQRAMLRLSIIVPIVIAAVFLLLWITLGRLRDAAIILLNVPLALIGGVLGLLAFGEYLSVPASVGFIALFGIAVQNGVVLVSTIAEMRRAGAPLHEALVESGVLRLRPVLMTALTTVLGLTPLLLSSGIGSEVQRPLAVVVVCGLTTSTLLTLFVIPAVYRLVGAAGADSSSETATR